VAFPSAGLSRGSATGGSNEGPPARSPGTTVSGSCPDCGADVEFATREVQLTSGTCPDCGKTSIVIAGGGAASVDLPPGAVPGARAESGDDEETVGSGVGCPRCGEPLQVESITETAFSASCAGCHGHFSFSSGEGRGEMERPRSYDRPRSFGRDSDGDSGGRPPSRPCRECGGPLRFSTAPDGSVVGECSSCGNRFNLPPRRDGPRGRPGYGNPRRGYDRGGGGRGGGWSGGARGPPRTGTYRRRERDSDDDEAPRRRRPRRE